MTTAQNQSVVVGLAELQVSNDPNQVLTCLGLGSCIGVAAYDPQAKVSGMVHVVLPSSDGKSDGTSPKFADTAIPTLVKEMEKLGASQKRMVIKIAGGAQMTLSVGAASLFKTGERNAEAVKEALASARIPIVASEIGGHKGRTLKLHVATGETTVGSAGGQTVDL